MQGRARCARALGSNLGEMQHVKADRRVRAAATQGGGAPGQVA